MDRFSLVSVNDGNLKEYSRLFNALFPSDVPTTDTAKAVDYERWVVRDPTGEGIGICGLYGLRGYKGDVWLDWYGILPAYRGAGLGRDVLMALIEKAKQRGGCRFMIWTTELELHGTKLDKFYRSIGFHKTAWMLDYNGSIVFTYDKRISEGTPVCRAEDLDPDDWLH